MPLQRETVAHAALQLLDEVGLDGLTMRRLATYLNIQNPSLYWHFKNKQELLNCMAELIITEAFTGLQSPGPEQDWSNWLAAWARRVHKTMLAHRDGARVLAEADLSLNNFFEAIELALNILQHAGFDASTANTGIITIIHYAMGAVFELQADPSALASEEGEKRSLPLKPPVDTERFPKIVTFLSSAETWFDKGLSLLLDGLRANLPKEHLNATSK
jgi:TetR/AcrR family tetracycline transcriptional repressor